MKQYIKYLQILKSFDFLSFFKVAEFEDEKIENLEKNMKKYQIKSKQTDFLKIHAYTYDKKN